MSTPEVWGGVECTYNRVGDRYFDQLVKNGHYDRIEDLELFASLGIKKLRYPCVWEKVAPKDLDHFDWSFLDERLTEIRRVGIAPIAGFLHHGSGPLYTSLIDPDFPTKLATYARAFATRYPWVEDYTPINEILTTARFSTLYGHWYPHLKDELYLFKSVIYQCKGTVLSMREIRAVNPKARLIQTDDIGKCQGTEPVQEQVNFENERRWLAFDILCGKVTRDHSMFQRMLATGITEEEILWFQENSCPPDVIGLNHYHLSNRFLDHRMEYYPKWSHGGNGKIQYADVGAVDTGQAELPKPEEIFKEAWDRYHIPLAVTEVHTRGYRESQLRWVIQIWNAALKAQSEGVDFKAITVWSLLGTYDWNTLCTQDAYFYEPGVFDLRNPNRKPRPTALMGLIKELAAGKFESRPILEMEGYWTTPRRILWGSKVGDFSPLDFRSKSRPILITGATGTLGQAYARVCGSRNISYQLVSRAEMDITDPEAIDRVIKSLKPWAVLNTAGYVRVDDAEDDQERCFRENVDGPVNLARACAAQGIPFLTFSSDLVFDGSQDSAYLESHIVSPLNIYGKSKALSEKKVLEAYPKALIVRTSSFFGPWDQYNFVTNSLVSLLNKCPVLAVDDIKVSPTYVPDLANETIDLLLDGEFGIVHMVNDGEVTWSDLARQAAESFSPKQELDLNLIQPMKSDEIQFKAKRPRYSVLRSEKHMRLPPLREALERYVQEIRF